MADEGGGLLQRVRLMLDKASAKETQDAIAAALADGSKKGAEEGKKNVEGFGQAVDELKKKARELGEVLLAAFALEKLYEFVKESIAAFGEEQEAALHLQQALENIGVSYESVEGRIEQVTKALQSQAAIADSDVSKILTRLVVTTGDYEKSLANVSVVIDFAKMKHLDYERAAQIVGRAMEGNTQELKRYIANIHDGDDAVLKLSAAVHGFASVELQGIKGQTEKAKIAWEEFHEAIGRALVETENGRPIMLRLADAIDYLTEWVDKNRSAISGLGDVMSAVLRYSIGPLIAGIGALIGTFGDMAGFFAGWQAVEATMPWNSPAEKAAMLEHATQLEAMKEKYRTLEAQMVSLGKAVISGGIPSIPGSEKQDIPDVLGAIHPAGWKPDKPGADDTRREKEIRLAKEGLTLDGLEVESRSKLVDLEQQLQTELAKTDISYEKRVVLSHQLKEVQDALAPAKIHNFGEAVTATLEAIMEGTRDLTATLFALGEQAFRTGNIMELFSKKGVAAIAGEVLRTGALKVLQNIAAAMEEHAKGVAAAASGIPWEQALAPLHFEAMREHEMAAAKWGLVATAGGVIGASVGGGGSGGGSGGGGGGSSGGGIGSTAQQTPITTEIHIALDGIDPDNPRHQDYVYDTYGNAINRHGADVYVNDRRLGASR